jgi:elongator complex protein 3
MATTTVTATIRKKDANLPPENERFLRCCADIANALIEDHEAAKDPARPRKDINLNTLRAKFAKKHKINNVPSLTAIIAAVPEHYKKYILPRLIAKPIRESAVPAAVA